MWVYSPSLAKWRKDLFCPPLPSKERTSWSHFHPLWSRKRKPCRLIVFFCICAILLVFLGRAKKIHPVLFALVEERMSESIHSWPPQPQHPCGQVIVYLVLLARSKWLGNSFTSLYRPPSYLGTSAYTPANKKWASTLLFGEGLGVLMMLLGIIFLLPSLIPISSDNRAVMITLCCL